MKTNYLYFDNQIDNEAVAKAATFIQAGELVAFPTETVYGLGADATNEEAVAKIFQAKGRPSDNPLIVHIASKDQLTKLVRPYPEYVNRLIEAFSPGPITYVLPNSGIASAQVTAGLDTIGVRIPKHPAAQALLTACNCPVAAPSANLSGKPSPTTGWHVREDMDGKIAAILDGGAAEVGVESTVVDCTGNKPVILRLGEVTAEDIATIVEVQRNNDEKKEDKPKSPGTKYNHYMPEVPLILVRDVNMLPQVIRAEQAAGKRVGALVTDQTAEHIVADRMYRYGKNEQELARNLYNNLRLMHQKEIDIVVAEAVTFQANKSAVLDRLTRAATKII